MGQPASTGGRGDIVASASFAHRITRASGGLWWWLGCALSSPVARPTAGENAGSAPDKVGRPTDRGSERGRELNEGLPAGRVLSACATSSLSHL